jgi:hypothetical protein
VHILILVKWLTNAASLGFLRGGNGEGIDGRVVLSQSSWLVWAGM